MIPNGFILSDIALAVMIVLIFGGMFLLIISMVIENFLDVISRFYWEFKGEDE